MQSPSANIDLLTKSYAYELPAELIAQRPLAARHDSRLLVYDESRDTVTHTSFKNLPDFLPQNALIALNQSKVFPCRLEGTKSSGGKAQALFLSLIKEEGLYPVMLKSRGKKNLSDRYLFGELELVVQKIEEDGTFLASCNFEDQELLDYLNANASIPIPPYIRDGLSDEKDASDYQTVFAQKLGSVAAPTAGLHFTPEVFRALKAKGIDTAKLTLHVGAGTFKPVTADSILEHKMHHEYFELEESELDKLNSSSFVCAVGTTSLRTLESCYHEGKFVRPGFQSTDIFLYPGKEVRSIQALITNFHLPESTLLMLVSALIGREKTLELYRLAVQERYRFYSYGDAMLILRK